MSLLPLPITPADALTHVLEPTRALLPSLPWDDHTDVLLPTSAQDLVGRAADARSVNGTPLFRHACPDCGVEKLGDRRKVGKPCHACAMRRRATHGKTGTPIYKLWCGMRARCKYPSATNYSYYGARGISVCPEWDESFEVFAEWAEANGYRKGLEIDRIDNDGNYEPSNCQFIRHRTNSQKRSNSRTNLAQAHAVRRRLLSWRGSLRQLAREMDLPYMVVYHIAKSGTWSNCA